MSKVDSHEFAEWTESVHGYAPFPWQVRLLDAVMSGAWPSAIALPTASGKTSVLDVAVFALACQAGRARGERTTPLRVAFVVDRRIVVDGAFDRAEKIARSLDNPTRELGERVAAALRSYGGEKPLRVSKLRGGIYREDRWARSPREPAILCSTVDQVGSRLLHRGYGLSPHMWPIHAGLLGQDTLFVLDEAHCSVPFEETLRAIETLRQRAERPIDLPWSFVTMTATPREGAEPFVLDDADRANAVLAARMNARKPIRLRECAKDDGSIVKALAEEVQSVAKMGETVLVVVNRVKLARGLKDELDKRTKGSKALLQADVALLTGRVRGVDRDKLLKRLENRIMAQRDRLAFVGDVALVLVATQCVEVGADLDVDALISQACPLDALRQRLGRLDRLGQQGTSPCVVVVPADMEWAGGSAPVPTDSIYGEAVAHTVKLLRTANAADGALDGGIEAFQSVVMQATDACLSPETHAPFFFPVYGDLFAQTSPKPAESPEPALFLHGPDTALGEVQLIYRADLEEGFESLWAEIVALSPPLTSEALSLRIDIVRGFLEGTGNSDNFSDLEGEHQEPDDKYADKHVATPFLIWSGPETSETSHDATALRPGMTIVVPTSAGGCDRFGWAPAEKSAATDLAEEAMEAQHRSPCLRIHSTLLQAQDGAELHRLAEACPDELSAEIVEAIDAVIASLAAAGTRSAPPVAQQLDFFSGGAAVQERKEDSRSDARAAIATQLTDRRTRRVHRHPSGKGFVVVRVGGWADDAIDFTDEDDSSLRAPRELTLEQHLTDVEELAREHTAQVGLPEALARDVALAGLLHDLGKADSRFQAWLYDGNRLAAISGNTLAKSPKISSSKAARAQARERAGYPRGGRHELVSLRMAESATELMATATDADLVLHLVASHHGQCRPFAPVVTDDRPITVTFVLRGTTFTAHSETGLEALDSGVSERFYRLLRRYGWWGLAYLEACLRLADHRASERAAEERS